MRMEDLDAGRSRPEFVDGIFEDLRWLGFHWDEEPLVQSQRTAVYAHALEQLRGRGLVYACFCSRADIAAASSAPHGPAGAAYPGTCRGVADHAERRAREPHSWRLDSAKALALTGVPEWAEADARPFTASSRRRRARA